MTKDELGDELKKLEAEAPAILDAQHPICLRLDGRAFHTFTKGLERPYDKRLSRLMVETTKYLVKQSNAVLGYTQSDEITLIIVQNKVGQLPYSGKRQKLESISAALCSTYFNLNLVAHIPEKFVLPDEGELPVFDCRSFNVPVPYNSLVIKWRQEDCSRNSVSMLARSYYKHDDIHGVSTYDLKRRLVAEHGVSWQDYPEFFKYGTFIRPIDVQHRFTEQELLDLPIKHAARSNPDLLITRRSLEVFHENLHLVNNIEGFLFNNEPANRRFSCAI